MPPSSRLRAVIVLALALAGCSRWSRQHTLLEVGFAVTTMADWAQTRGIVSVCEEQNPVIGACGERMSPGVYFPISIALHAVVSAALPPRWRAMWQAVGIGAQLNQVWHNNALGYGMDGSVPGRGYRTSGDRPVGPRLGARPLHVR